MALTDAEIRRDLTAFAARWSVYTGSERSEAQTFLNQLFACYGTDRQAIATFEQHQVGGFVDLLWPEICIFEMKRPSEAARLPTHRKQVLDYWRAASDVGRGVRAPRFVVLCAFSKLEIWEPGDFPNAPRLELDLIDLPDRYDALLFLANREPVFSGGNESVTRDAVAHLTGLFFGLGERKAAQPDVLRDFILQVVWCMFAEDLAMLPAHAFTRVVDGLIDSPSRSSADDLGRLFELLDDPAPGRPTAGLYMGVPYANGSLFRRPARVHLDRAELEALRAASDFQWRAVEPAIFGSLLEGGLGKDRQWALGAHYTHEVDIAKVVGPTIVEPWTERIDNVRTHSEAKKAQADLMSFIVLDPACGSGNFLYVAYRELRRIEKRLGEIERSLRTQSGLQEQQSLNVFFPIGNIRGIEIDPFGVQLARVTLWIGHKLAVDELQVDESVLPLRDLSGIQRGDALQMQWPAADAIVGNPPFHGTKLLRSLVGDAYIEWLREEFDIGVKDYSAYWFLKAMKQLAPNGRAGLVVTNSLREGKNREATLDHLPNYGSVITSAVASQPWSGAANVHVSIVNWVREPDELPPVRMLDGHPVAEIQTTLRAGERHLGSPLTANLGRHYYGVVPSDEGGFILTDDEAHALLDRRDADYAAVVKPYLIGDDIAKTPACRPSRWIIDFAERGLEDAAKWPSALDIVRSRVKPFRDRHTKRRERLEWWKFSRTVPDMFIALSQVTRFIACPAQGKRFLMAWCEPSWCPSNLTSVFAFDDDFSFGVLSSRIHTSWAREQSTTLETRPRYTVASFASFPWPTEARPPQREEVARIGRDMHSLTAAICLREQIGLTTLWNHVDEGAYRQVADLRDQLDIAAGRCYGWDATVSLDMEASNRALLDLNRRIAAGSRAYAPFATG